MKKSLKIALIAGIASVISSIIVTSADNYITFVGIDLKSFSGITTIEETYTKTQDYVAQEYENIGTTANFGGDKLNVDVRTTNIGLGTTSLWLTISHGQKKAWSASTQNSNHFAGNYKIAFRTSSSTVWGANHSGMWFYN